MIIHLADITPIWVGVDSATPPGHCIVDGTDGLGRRNITLYAAVTPLDDDYRGRVQLAADGLSPTHLAYDSRGTFAGSGHSVGDLLDRLADRRRVADFTEEPPR